MLGAIALAVLSVFWQASVHIDRTAPTLTPLTPLAREAVGKSTPHRSTVRSELRSVRPLSDSPALRSVMQPITPSHGASSPMTLSAARRAGI